MIAVATKNDLLILRPDSSRPVISGAIPNHKGDYVFPLSWILTGRLQGALMIDAETNIWEVTGVSMRGIEGRAYFGMAWSAYLFLVVVGVPTLALPVRVTLSTSLVEKSDIEKVRSQVLRWIHKNPKPYVHCAVDRLERKVKRARTVAGIAEALYSG